MAKDNKIFVCDNCGNEFLKWQGKCTNCGEWNSLKEIKLGKSTERRNRPISDLKAKKISEISDFKKTRLKTGIEEFDRTLGGGFVPGSLVLLAGEPGIGKSTLILQTAALIKKVLYVSGEESPSQIKMRIERLKIKNPNLYILTDSDLENVIQNIEEQNPDLVIIDSIQTMQTTEIPSVAGSITQVKISSLKLQTIAKQNQIPIVLTSHVTKEGVVAGPMTLEHLVDAVIYLEGERFGPYRILRAVKNRFGKISEVGIFEMKETGMEEVKNPAGLFLDERLKNVPGNAIGCVLEGTRPMLVEIQALTSPSIYGYPRRVTWGIDLNRLYLQIAVLGKRAGLNLANLDIYLNVVGGFKIKEPAIDLACYLSMASAAKNLVTDPTLVSIGEVGLSGEIKPVIQLENRISEVAKLGFKKIIIPNVKIKTPSKIKIIKVKTLLEAVNMALLK